MPVLFPRCWEDERGDVLCEWDVKFLMSCACVVARCWEDERGDSLCRWHVQQSCQPNHRGFFLHIQDVSTVEYLSLYIYIYIYIYIYSVCVCVCVFAKFVLKLKQTVLVSNK